MVRFQLYVTRQQHDFLKKLSEEKGISGGYVMRRGLTLYAKQKQGVTLDVGPQLYK